MQLKDSPTSAALAGKSSLDFGYEALPHWGQLPDGWRWQEVVGVATDSQDRVFVFDRGEHPVTVFDRDGKFLGSWGEGVVARAHGITIGPDDSIYLTDDLQHTVRKFTPEGKLLLTLGRPDQPSATGATSMDYRSIVRASGPFHFPTNLALSPAGEMYVSDGYGNARIHKFSPKGELLLSWGEPGAGPGQFYVPHGIAVDRHGTVYVADRENCRLQLFNPQGEFVSQWTDIARPCEVFIDEQDDVWVAELGFRAGMWPGTTAPTPDATGGRLSVFNTKGELKARWGGGSDPCAVGDFFAPHDVWIDSRGDAYISEVAWSGGGKSGLVSPTCHTLQKFIWREGAQR
jgi:DNA-binding beta-propeller fold protein YncE